MAGVLFEGVEAGGSIVVINSLTIVSDDAAKPTILDLLDGDRLAIRGAAAVAGTNPYCGLEAFDEADAARFFGREAEVEKLWAACEPCLRRRPLDPISPRLITVIGPSGSGKSSVVRAGLLPLLLRRMAPTPFRVAVLKPGGKPLQALAGTLAKLQGAGERLGSGLQILEALRRPDPDGSFGGLGSLIALLGAGEGAPFLLIVDQFEEIYALCTDRAEQDAFVANVLGAAGGRTGATVVLTLRSDFLGETARQPMLNRAITERQVMLRVMDTDELRRAIAEPARQAGAPFDDALVELLMTETRGRPGALPLLQFALSRLWERRREGAEPSRALREMGGIGGALASEAERLFGELTEAQQRVARRAFLAQVQLGEGAKDTRRRAAVAELVAQGERSEQVLDVVRAFAQPNRRLLTLTRDAAEGEAQLCVELAHEALLEHWARLGEWLEQGRDDLRFQRRVAEAATEWDRSNRNAGLLWRRPNLDLLRRYHARAAAEMTPVQVAFLQASEREWRNERWRRRVAVAAVFLLLTGLLGTASWFNYEAWTRQRPWAELEDLKTGEIHRLSGTAANIGRWSEDSAIWPRAVNLRDRTISRLHATIFPERNTVVDLRNLNGTFVNALIVSYGTGSSLQDGDLVVVAGIAAFRYRTIDWRPIHWLVAAPPRTRSPVSEGWALVLDGLTRSAVPLPRETAPIAFDPRGALIASEQGDAFTVRFRRRLESRPAAVSNLVGRAPTTDSECPAETTGCITLEFPQIGPPVVAVIKRDDRFEAKIAIPRGREIGRFLLDGMERPVEQAVFRVGDQVRFQVIWGSQQP